MSSSKRTSTPPKEWAKHLRPFGKKTFWSSVRNVFRSEEKEELVVDIDVEELKENKEKYEKELRASLNAEPEKGIPVKDQHGNILFHTDMLMPCPEGFKNPNDTSVAVNALKELAHLHNKTITVNTRERNPKVLSDTSSGIEPPRTFPSSLHCPCCDDH